MKRTPNFIKQLKHWSITGHGVGVGITAIAILGLIAMIYNLLEGSISERVRRDETRLDDRDNKLQGTHYAGSNRILWGRIKNGQSHRRMR